jgi:hypothetical protein
MTDMLDPQTHAAEAASAEPISTPITERLSSERLLSALGAYEAASADAQEVYRHLLREDGDPLMSGLLNVALEEHRRHQQTMGRLAELVRGVPAAPLRSGARVRSWFATPAASEAIRFLIREERANAQHLRHLARQEPNLGAGLFAATLETLARDDDKHEHLLRFLLRRFEANSRLPDVA